MPDLTTPQLDLSHFARHFHALIDYEEGGENFISSPLGAWILLAQTVGPNPADLTSHERERIEEWLGCDITTAYNQLDRLLADVPEPVKLAVAAWFEPTFANQPRVGTWRSNLLSTIETGVPIPNKKDLDAWADKNTLGIIPTFPIDEKTLQHAALVFANALATKIKWAAPFDEAENSLTHWHAEKLLKASSGKHTIHFTRDEDANLYAVVRNSDTTGLNVYAVIAENRDLGAQHVLEFAEKYAAGVYNTAVNAGDLPADSPIYKMTDIMGMQDKYTALLPAWTAESGYDLLQMNMPFPEAIHALIQDPPESMGAVQVAKAEYNKLGFEAAAISMLTMRSASMPVNNPHKKVDVEFGHNYAVVAAFHRFRRTPGQEPSFWTDVPLFSAWVRKAAPVSDKSFG